ncbi:MAG: protein-glutamate O-methyltransferase CheR [Succinivibrio sp.]|nr:protein-glutamate O-methyltransferase CheR [Succinivibrio sp.]
MAFSFFRKKDDSQTVTEQKSTLSTLNKPAGATGGLGDLKSGLSRSVQGQSTFRTAWGSGSAAASRTLANSATTQRTTAPLSSLPSSGTAGGLSRPLSGVGVTAAGTLSRETSSPVKPAVPSSAFTAAPRTATAPARPVTGLNSGVRPSGISGSVLGHDDAKSKFESIKTRTTISSRNPDVVPQKSPRPTGKPNADKDVSDVQYRRFSAFIEEKCGIVLGSSRQYLVNSRLSGLLSRFKVETVDDLINIAMEEKPNNAAQEAVIDAMTTNETLWFRDTYPYLALQNIILPELAMKGKDYGVRIWSAACSSGQEPYSIAMIIQEQMTHMVHIDPNKAQIVGTDLSPDMLAQCRRGIYDSHALSRGLSPERRAKFFKPSGKPNQMKVDTRIKSMVEFRPLNLLGSFALMGKFDVIFCRNVLIYFSNEVKTQILNKLTMCLNPRGYLILGSSESLTGVAEKYEMIRCAPGIIYRLKPSKF